MDERYSWKKTDEIEIDLADLFKRFLRQWKRIAACACLAAVVLGGYGWLKGQGGPDTEVPVMLEDAELTEDEQRAVEDAVQLDKDNRELETYLDHSLLMQADPYHKARQSLLYCIDRADRQNLAAVTESYLNYVANGGAAEALKQSSDNWEMDRSYLAELITAYQKTYSYPYQAVINSTADSSLTAESLFYVEITGRNAEETRKMACDMQDVLEKYSKEAGKKAGSHRLRLVSSAESITADNDLKERQRDKRNQLASGRANLKTMTDAFSIEQMAVYRKASGAQDAEESADGQAAFAGAGSGFRTAGKYGLTGFLAGILVYGCVYACWYVFSDTVKNAGELKRLYAFPVYGQIQPGRRTGGEMQQAFNRIRLVCKKQGVEKLCAASDFPLTVPERECLNEMAAQLAGCGITMSVAESVSTDVAVWDGLAQTGNVLLVCKAGTTTHQAIDDSMDFYRENGIAVAGAAVFSGNG